MAEATPLGTGMTASILAPLPSPPANDVLTLEQWTTLLSMMDTFIPSITSFDGEDRHESQLAVPGSEYVSATSALASLLPTTVAEQRKTDLIKAYLYEPASSVPGFKAQIHRTLGQYTPPEPLASLSKIL